MRLGQELDAQDQRRIMSCLGMCEWSFLEIVFDCEWAVGYEQQAEERQAPRSCSMVHGTPGQFQRSRTRTSTRWVRSDGCVDSKGTSDRLGSENVILYFTIPLVFLIVCLPADEEPMPQRDLSG